MSKLLQFLIFAAVVCTALSMPLEDFAEATTAKIIPVHSQLPVNNNINNNNNPGVQTTHVNNNNDKKHGIDENVSYGYLQTVRKQWKCTNGKCEETITKCKNGQCDSVENRFKADNYQPELPNLEPFPIQIPQFNFAELFKQFLNFDLPSPFNFDNTGLLDTVVDTKNLDYYFTNAKFINSKCNNHVCEIKTRTCTNGKCDEEVSTRNF